MKKFTITLVLMLLVVMQLEAQKLKFYNKDGTSDEHLLSEILRIEPQNLTENYQMKINKKDGTSVTKDLDDVDSLKYSNGNLLVYINGSSTSYAASNIASVEFYIASGGSEETVTIGTQEWMKKNLEVTKYTNGDTIRFAATNEDWVDAGNKGEGAWCYFENDPTKGEIYGKLYNWFAVNDPRGLAPVGYHIPSDTEWTELTDFLGGQNLAGGAMKETGTTLWYAPNEGATNSSGFSGLPGGYRFGSGGFYDARGGGIWWTSTIFSSTHAWYRYLSYNNTKVLKNNITKMYGMSVRCVKD